METGGKRMVERLTLLLNKRWERQYVPDDWRHGAIVKLPKKESLSGYGN